MSDWLARKLAQLEDAEGYVMPESAAGKDQSTSDPKLVKLDANENIFLPPDIMTALGREVADELDPRFYSTAEYAELAEALSQRLGLAPECIVLGNGGDQIIDFVARTFLDAKSKAVSIRPTYSFYRLRARLTGASWTEIPLEDDFSLNVNRLLDVAREAQMIFLCSPNNPTGNQFQPQPVRTLLQSFDGLVVVDEAYAEFAGQTLAQWVKEFRHLIIMRTFSKAFGLADLRLGYMIADPSIARPFADKMQYPYGVSAFTLRMGLKLLQRYDLVQQAMDRMKAERVRLIQALNSIPGVKAFDSATNFVLFQLQRPVDAVHQELVQAGLFLKKIGDVLSYSNCLRVTVGTPEMNNQLIEALRRMREA